MLWFQYGWRAAPGVFPVTLDDGEAVRIIELFPDPNPRPDQTLIEKESLVAFDEFKHGFSAAQTGRLVRLFQLYCDDQSKPADVASSLKLRRSTVKNLQRRFRRRWAEFHRGSFPNNGHSDQQSHAA